jgi:hypothetical protein
MFYAGQTSQVTRKALHTHLIMQVCGVAQMAE